MKILNVNISIDSSREGGTAERTYQMSRFLANSQIECTILTLFSSLTEEQRLALNGINLIMLPCLSRRFYIPSRGLRKIKEAVKEADVIHLMSHWTLLNVIVYYYIRVFNKPYVVCPAGALPVFGRSKLIKKIFNFIIGKKIIKNASGHIAVADNEFAHYQAYGIKKERVTLIPNGINQDDYTPELPHRFSETWDLPKNYILFMGRLSYIKAPDLLLKAFIKLAPQYKNYHLVFAGPDGGMLPELEMITKQNDISHRVHFLGQVNGNDKTLIYYNSSFLVIPSRQEAMSMVVLEAGMCAKPALITNQCGFDILQKINGGIVVPVTMEDLEQGLITMLSGTNRQQMGENLREFILKNYTWDIVGKKIVFLYHSALSQ